ncbi:hypothetical protein D3C71_1722630 [compost metagenome]
MGQIRHAVLGLDGFHCLGQRRADVAGLAGGRPRGSGQFAEALQQRQAVQPLVGAKVPVDFQGIATQLRRPVMIGYHRDPGRHLHYFMHPRQGQRGLGVE